MSFFFFFFFSMVWGFEVGLVAGGLLSSWETCLVGVRGGMFLGDTVLTFGCVIQKPYVESKGRKFERARGRRRSRGFKV